MYTTWKETFTKFKTVTPCFVQSVIMTFVKATVIHWASPSLGINPQLAVQMEINYQFPPGPLILLERKIWILLVI